MSPRVLNSVIHNEQAIQTHAAILSNHRRSRVKNAHYPAVVADAGHSVEGTVVYNLSDSDVAKLDHFEGSEYERRQVTVTDKKTNEAIEANVYIWIDGTDRLEDTDWDFDLFSGNHIDEFMRSERYL